MNNQILFTKESLVTLLAENRVVIGVPTHVNFHIRVVAESCGTNVANELLENNNITS